MLQNSNEDSAPILTTNAFALLCPFITLKGRTMDCRIQYQVLPQVTLE